MAALPTVAAEPELARAPRGERMTAELWQHDAWELAERVRGGDVSAGDLLELSLARIEQFDPKLNAVCFVDADQARADAERIDRRVAAGDDPGAFAGIPMGVKELAQVRVLRPDARMMSLSPGNGSWLEKKENGKTRLKW